MAKLRVVYRIRINKMPGRRGYKVIWHERGLKHEFGPIYCLDCARYWFRYKQSLIEYKYVKINTAKNRMEILFYEGAERLAEIYRLYLLSLVGLKGTNTKQKALHLAKCFANLDPISPVLDTLNSLGKMIKRKRFVAMLRAYCIEY